MARRAAARVVDQLVWLALLMAVTTVLGVWMEATGRESSEPGGVDRGHAVVVNLAWTVLIGLYETVAVARFGTTLGKRMLGVHVVAERWSPTVSGLIRAVPVVAQGVVQSWEMSLPEQVPVTWSLMVFALVGPALLLLVLDRRRRVVWDLLAGTAVVSSAPSVARSGPHRPHAGAAG